MTFDNQSMSLMYKRSHQLSLPDMQYKNKTVKLSTYYHKFSIYTTSNHQKNTISVTSQHQHIAYK